MGDNWNVNNDGMLTIGGIHQVRYSTDFDTVAAASTTAGIEEAIDDLPATGGVVVVPAGTHTISTTITVDEPITIKGGGRGVTIIYLENASNVDMFTLPANQGDVTIRDMTLDLNQANNATDGNGIYGTDGNDNCLFENLEIQNCREDGIHMDYAATGSVVTINNCYIHDGILDGVVLDRNEASLIVNCRILDNNSDGIYINAGNDNRVFGNLVLGNTADPINDGGTGSHIDHNVTV